MKVIVISDIHGDIDMLNVILEKMEMQKIDKLVILGDFCSYYDDSLDVARRLKTVEEKIICVKGNCDTKKFVENFKLELPLYQNIVINNHNITITHGHIYNPYYFPVKHHDIILYGHTHRKSIDIVDGVLCINPGSVARPRDMIKSYILIENDNLYIRDMDDNVLDSCNLNLKRV